MSGIYISGMEMPTAEQGVRTINIYADGVVTNYAEVTIGTAVPIPPGRLIDADALIKGVEADAIWKDDAINEYADGIRAGARAMMRSIRNAPTIIPAESEGDK